MRLYLRPGDRNTQPLRSKSVNTNDLLMRITVPKRTGRKRKRGDTGPFQEPSIVEAKGSASEHRIGDIPARIENARFLKQCLRDYPSRSKLDVIGKIECTHRFRGWSGFGSVSSCIQFDAGLPDFVTSTSNAPFMNKIKETILPFECESKGPFGGVKTNVV